MIISGGWPAPALAVSLGGQVNVSGPLEGLRRKWWYQSLMSAQCSYHLGDMRGLRRDEAFVCGLLHDFGQAPGFQNEAGELGMVGPVCGTLGLLQVQCA